MGTVDSIKIADYKLVKDSAVFNIFRTAGKDSLFFTRGGQTYAIKDSAGTANAWAQGGNSFGALGVFGTNDNFAIDVELNNVAKHRFHVDGTLSLNSTADQTAILYVNGRSRFTQLLDVENGAGLSAVSGAQMNNWGANGPANSVNWTLNNIYQNTAATKNFFRIAADVTTTAATTQTINQLLVNPTINNTNGTTTLRGYYYSPVLTAVTGTTNIAFENESGLLRFKAVGTPPSTYTLLVHSLQADSNVYQIPSSTFTTPSDVADQINDSLSILVTVPREPLITLLGAGGDPDTLAIAGLNGFGTTGQSIRINAAADGFEYYTPTTATTLYSGDGSLSGNRTVTMSANTLNFTGGNVGFSTSGPDRLVDILSNAAPQLRLTHTDGSVYSDVQVDGNGVLSLIPTGRNVRIPTGSTSNFAKAGGVIWSETSTDATSGTSETDLYSFTTPTNTLGADGEWLEFTVEGIVDGTGTGTHTLRIYWAGTEVLEAASTISTIGSYQVRVRVLRTSSSNARVTANVIGGGFAFVTTGTNNNPTITNVTTTFSNTNIIKATGECTNASSLIDNQAGDLKWWPENLPGS